MIVSMANDETPYISDRDGEDCIGTSARTKKDDRYTTKALRARMGVGRDEWEVMLAVAHSVQPTASKLERLSLLSRIQQP